MTSSSSNCNSGSWSGDPIKLFHNDVEKAIIPSGFTDFEYCIVMDDVDIENDKFKLLAGGSNGVCINSLHVNNNQILVGKNNDMASFDFDKPVSPGCINHAVKTSQLTIQNGQVVESECTGKIIVNKTLMPEINHNEPNYFKLILN